MTSHHETAVLESSTVELSRPEVVARTEGHSSLGHDKAPTSCVQEAASAKSAIRTDQTTEACSITMQESERLPISGFLTLHTCRSKVFYTVMFSQEELIQPLPTKQAATETMRSQDAAAVPARGSHSHQKRIGCWCSSRKEKSYRGMRSSNAFRIGPGRRCRCITLQS